MFALQRKLFHNTRFFISNAFFTILTGKTVLYSVQYKNGWLAASDHFHMFTQSVKFYYTFYYHVLRVLILKIVIQ